MQNEDSRKAYCKVATDLVVYALGVIAGDIAEGLTTSFTTEMAEAGQRLITALQGPSTRNQSDALQAFLYTLFSQKRCGGVDKYTFLAYNFLVLYSFTGDGNLQPCNSFTQFFSKVVFFARVAIFNRITSDAERDHMGFFE